MRKGKVWWKKSVEEKKWSQNGCNYIKSCRKQGGKKVIFLRPLCKKI
jgi:hypothetical protein